MMHPITLPVPDQVQLELRARLLSGELEPGSRIKEQELASSFQVGRAIVRDAFRQLVQDGLLVSRPNCGVSVALPPDEASVAVLTDVRDRLETHALECWFRQRQPDHFAAWERVLTMMKHACADADHKGIIQADILFHELLFHHAGLETLLQVWRPAMLQLRAFHVRKNKTHPAVKLPFIHAIHTALLEEFRGRSLSRAQTALTSHVRDGRFNQAFKDEATREITTGRGRKQDGPA